MPACLWQTRKRPLTVTHFVNSCYHLQEEHSRGKQRFPFDMPEDWPLPSKSRGTAVLIGWRALGALESQDPSHGLWEDYSGHLFGRSLVITERHWAWLCSEICHQNAAWVAIQTEKVCHEVGGRRGKCGHQLLAEDLGRKLLDGSIATDVRWLSINLLPTSCSPGHDEFRLWNLVHPNRRVW